MMPWLEGDEEGEGGVDGGEEEEEDEEDGGERFLANRPLQSDFRLFIIPSEISDYFVLKPNL